MSYETYHKIKQLDNGDFLVTSKCSNDDCPPREWTMDYYRTAFPQLNNKQRKVAFVLQGLYSGNKYYPEQYKRLERFARDYCEDVYAKTGKYPYDDVVYGVPMNRKAYEREVKQIMNNPSGYIPYIFRENPNRSYDDYVQEINTKLLETVNDFLVYIKQRKREPIIQARIRLNNGYYVAKLAINSRNIAITPYEQEAQIFRKTQTDIAMLMSRIPKKYNPQITMIA